ncbi:uncharacterized protein LOC126355223 [Schistocerca gregaria]|uniref:uncharacterized protein LOC126355223 n=1 Tax=Schistocerca gregaria TaxID=7010 RepID=UPI00211F2ADA|nr:uncharacterized protein LOC126355223 [Schistocerca gregaria]
MKGLTELVTLLMLASSAAGRPPKCPPPGSAAPQYLPDDADGSAFWQCDRGVAYHKHCDDGLVWNAALSVCDWPSVVVVDAEDSGHESGTHSGGHSQDVSSHLSTRKDNVDIDGRYERRSSMSHFGDHHDQQGGESISEFRHMEEHHRHAKRPEEDLGYIKLPMEDYVDYIKVMTSIFRLRQ